MKKLSFDELMKLWKDAPEQAEEYRVAVIEEAIAKMPDAIQLKARAFQVRLEKDMSKYTDPMARANFAFGQMWDSFAELDQVLQEHLPKLNSKLLDTAPEKSI